MKGFIYCITCKSNGKKYIGKTYQTVAERFAEHLEKSGDKQQIHRPLYSAIRKYGKKNFSVETIGEFEEGTLELKEIEYIAHFNTFLQGYNATLGGEGTKKVILDDQAVIRDYEKLGSLNKVALKHSCSSQTIGRLLDSYKVPRKEASAKRVEIIDLNLTFDSIALTAAFLIENRYTKSSSVDNVRAMVSRHLRGKRASCLGMQFRYV